MTGRAEWNENREGTVAVDAAVADRERADGREHADGRERADGREHDNGEGRS